MATATVFDGHTVVTGMDAGTVSTTLSPSMVAKAVNRAFRGGNNEGRPKFQKLNLIFLNDEDEQLFRFGNLQGAEAYTAITFGRFDGIVVSIAGTVFFIALVNENGYVNRLIGGNDPFRMHAFFCQAEEWMYVQDGANLPIFWNGLIAPVRSEGKGKNQMPVGTVMCYAHGRVFVSNNQNRLTASDVMFGTMSTNTKDVQSFTETTYWQEGGDFVFPNRLGDISGMLVMPQLSNLRGQGELVVFGTNGAMSFDVSITRKAWKDSQIAKTAMIGDGCLAPGSIVSLSSDAWFRSTLGWSTYSNSRLETSQGAPHRKISAPVNVWLDSDNPNLVRYASHIAFDNRILGTVRPEALRAKSAEHGLHRFFNGIVALDMENAAGGHASFDGLWTGIRPTAMVTLRSKAYAFSFDADGENRLYEITRLKGDDNDAVKIKSHYITRKMVCEPSSASEFDRKRITGGEIAINEVAGSATVSISYRPDHSAGWNKLLVNEKVGNDGNFIAPRAYRKIKTPSPEENVCLPYTDSDVSNSGYLFQFLVEIEGVARVGDFRFHAEKMDSDWKTNIDAEDQKVVPIESLPDITTKDDFGYSIVTNG